jgi:hypothetical protein
MNISLFSPEKVSAYGPLRTRISVSVRDREGAVLRDKALLFFSEFRAFGRKQYRFEFAADQSMEADLPVGKYAMQVFVPGHETARQLVDLRPDAATKVQVTLDPRRSKPPSFEERLANYNLDLQKMQVNSLTLEAEKTLSLNYRTYPGKADFVALRAQTVMDLKKWIGASDHFWGHDQPIYGPLPEIANKKEALDRIAREYIHGNSVAVAKQAGALDALMASVNVKQVSRVYIFFYNIVTINAGATLVIGNGSNVFTCDELRIHKTGVLKPVGTVKIEIGTYKEFQ